jgi:hypothetical protein
VDKNKCQKIYHAPDHHVRSRFITNLTKAVRHASSRCLCSESATMAE